MAKRANFSKVVESSALPDIISNLESTIFTEERIIGVMITMPKVGISHSTSATCM
jgi:hypothetical protein